jgi:glycosyltransferase involved in cell wall biosynthesis
MTPKTWLKPSGPGRLDVFKFMKNPFFSVYLPAYNNSQVIVDTINSVLQQTYKNFELIVRDDASGDNTPYVVSTIQDKRLVLFRNTNNLGYSGNLNCGLKDCHGKYIVLLAGDDLLDRDTLLWYYQSIKNHPNVGAITRPYYWFENNFKKPVRLKKATESTGDLIVTLKSPFKDISLVLSSLDQLSGLCLKRNLISRNFSSEPWISHAYPWLEIFKKYPVVFLKNYSLAVRIGTSATRTNIYQKSPMYAWKNMIDTIFTGKQYQKIRNKITADFIGINYVGLFQIKNYGSFSSYLKEVQNLIAFNPKNIFNPKFVFIILLTFFTPPFILRKLTDKYKSIVYSQFIPQNIVINYKNK